MKMENIISANEEMNRWCGTKGINYYEGDTALGFLFKYAVPKVVKIIMAEQECDEELAYAILFKKWLQIGYEALALFWAIYPVLKETKSEQS